MLFFLAVAVFLPTEAPYDEADAEEEDGEAADDGAGYGAAAEG